jgi:hypothetical protein
MPQRGLFRNRHLRLRSTFKPSGHNHDSQDKESLGVAERVDPLLSLTTAFPSPASPIARRHLPPARIHLQATNQQLALIDHLRWQMVMQVEEKFLVADHLSPPGGTVYDLQLLKFLS